MEEVRSEAQGGTDLDRARQWLSRHRGQVVELDRTRQLELGVPIAGAGAVLVAVTLQTDGDRTPELGGVVRALGSPSDGQPVRLVFEGRSPARLPHADAQAAASELLATISGLIAEDEPIADVA